MRTRPALACLAVLALAGCDDSPVGPPTNLEATLLFEPTSSMAETPPSVTRTDDALVATTGGGMSGCFRDEATAGRVGNVVVVTLTHRELDQVCASGILYVTFRIEVRPLPAGARDVRFNERLVDVNGTVVFNRALAQADLTLR